MGEVIIFWNVLGDIDRFVCFCLDVVLDTSNSVVVMECLLLFVVSLWRLYSVIYRNDVKFVI